MMTPGRNRYWLNVDSVRELIDARHLSQQEFAAQVGVSRSYWSQLINGKRPVAPALRRAILGVLKVDEARLWVIERPAPAAS